MHRRLNESGARTSVFWSDEPDGDLWVRGFDYKASFGAVGATFIPFFGSDALRKILLHLGLDSEPPHLAPAKALEESVFAW